jgi:hypothetical protein
LAATEEALFKTGDVKIVLLWSFKTEEKET